jgi:hypothetical protein
MTMTQKSARQLCQSSLPFWSRRIQLLIIAISWTFPCLFIKLKIPSLSGYLNYSLDCTYYYLWRKLSLLSEAAQVYTATPFPINSLNWALIATVPAMSPVHFDAGKFCTQVKVLAGHKLWLVRDMTGSSAPGNLSECDVTSLSWIGCVLGPGHKLWVLIRIHCF